MIAQHFTGTKLVVGAEEEPFFYPKFGTCIYIIGSKSWLSLFLEFTIVLFCTYPQSDKHSLVSFLIKVAANKGSKKQRLRRLGEPFNSYASQ